MTKKLSAGQDESQGNQGDKEGIERLRRLREEIASQAKNRLDLLRKPAQDHVHKMVQKWERKAQKERQKKIAAKHEQMKRKIIERESQLPPLTTRVHEMKEAAPREPKREEPRVEEPRQGNWMRSDSFGVVIGGDVEEKYRDHRPPGVRRIYGKG